MIFSYKKHANELLFFIVTLSLLFIFSGGLVCAAEIKEDDLDRQIKKQEEEYKKIFLKNK